MHSSQERVDSKLDRLVESVDLLFARVGDLHHSQQKMQAHVDLTTRAVDQLVRDQIGMTQQLDATARAVERMFSSSDTEDSDSGERNFDPSSSRRPMLVGRTALSPVSPHPFVLLLRFGVLLTPERSAISMCRKCLFLCSMAPTPRSGLTSA